MTAYLRLLKFSLTGLAAVAGLTACHPAYVRESYQESYVPAYRYPSTPAYSVQYYSTAPTYVEKTVVIPSGGMVRPYVTLPHAGHAESHHYNQWRGHNRNWGEGGSATLSRYRRGFPLPRQ